MYLSTKYCCPALAGAARPVHRSLAAGEEAARAGRDDERAGRGRRDDGPTAGGGVAARGVPGRRARLPHPRRHRRRAPAAGRTAPRRRRLVVVAMHG